MWSTVMLPFISICLLTTLKAGKIKHQYCDFVKIYKISLECQIIFYNSNKNLWIIKKKQVDNRINQHKLLLHKWLVGKISEKILLI